jgi:hypothetical protein
LVKFVRQSKCLCYVHRPHVSCKLLPNMYNSYLHIQYCVDSDSGLQRHSHNSSHSIYITDMNRHKWQTAYRITPGLLSYYPWFTLYISLSCWCIRSILYVFILSIYSFSTCVNSVLYAVCHIWPTVHLGMAFKFKRKNTRKNNFFEENVKRIRIGKLVFGNRYIDLKYIFLRLLNKLFTMVLKD